MSKIEGAARLKFKRGKRDLEKKGEMEAGCITMKSTTLLQS